MSRTLAELIVDFERVSRLYVDRCGIERDADWFVLKLQEELGELVQARLRLTGRGRVKGEGAEALRLQFEDECADLLGQLLLLANQYDVDLEIAARRKWFRYLEPPERTGPD
jgi:NTP pyrophosphatase (non-canonical NTP hydrolase)